MKTLITLLLSAALVLVPTNAIHSQTNAPIKPGCCTGPMIVITVIFAGMTFYILWKACKLIPAPEQTNAPPKVTTKTNTPSKGGRRTLSLMVSNPVSAGLLTLQSGNLIEWGDACTFVLSTIEVTNGASTNLYGTLSGYFDGQYVSLTTMAVSNVLDYGDWPFVQTAPQAESGMFRLLSQ